MSSQTTFVVTAPFEAARQLGTLAAGHRARNLHGHSFQASIRCAPPTGYAEYAGGELDAMRARLLPVIGQLDYGLLNEHIAVPSDENIAQWILAHCKIPDTQCVTVQSTADQGLLLDTAGKRVDRWKRFYFQAAHRLPHVGPHHKCGNMHGHGFAVVLHASHAWQEHAAAGTGYDNLQSAWNPVLGQLDHACLNHIEGLENPTSELLSRWIWEKIKPAYAALTKVTVFETASCGANYDGSVFQIWKDFSFDSAARMRHAPADSPRARLHGYTYNLRLHLSASLDELAGWAIDFGDVKDLFSPVFKAIDHQNLEQLAGLADCDTASIAHWIWSAARPLLPQIFQIDLMETRGCGVHIRSGLEAPNLPL